MDYRLTKTRTKFWALALALVAGFVASSPVASSGSAGAAAASRVAPSHRAVVALGYDVSTASSLTVVVNKLRPLSPLTYHPAKFGSYNLAKPASDALVAMRSAMAKAGAGDLLLASGYRSYASQKAVFDRNVSRFGEAEALALTAKPGYSEHQTGLAADLWATGQGCRVFPCFAGTTAGKWLAANAFKFGFILRYPNGAAKVTGYDFEPWHFRFVGKKLAGEMHAAKATVLETFLGLKPAPKYVTK